MNEVKTAIKKVIIYYNDHELADIIGSKSWPMAQQSLEHGKGVSEEAYANALSYLEDTYRWECWEGGQKPRKGFAPVYVYDVFTHVLTDLMPDPPKVPEQLNSALEGLRAPGENSLSSYWPLNVQLWGHDVAKALYGPNGVKH